nr:hypothetical protein [Halomarina sp. BND7]
MAFDALVDHVADRVRDEDAERAIDDYRRRVQIALHHSHLPKLEACRMIEYQSGTDHIRLVSGELEQHILALVESYDVNK